jgi:hypothetical protein
MEYIFIESSQSKNYSFDKIIESINKGTFKKYKEIYHNHQTEVRRIPNGNIVKLSNCKGFLIFYNFLKSVREEVG